VDPSYARHGSYGSLALLAVHNRDAAIEALKNEQLLEYVDPVFKHTILDEIKRRHPDLFGEGKNASEDLAPSRRA